MEELSIQVIIENFYLVSVRFINYSTNYEVVYNIYSISIEILIRGLENPPGAGLWVRLERFRDIFQDLMWKI